MKICDKKNKIGKYKSFTPPFFSHFSLSLNSKKHVVMRAKRKKLNIFTLQLPTFSLIELQMLLRCCFIHISIITVRHFLYLLYLCSWLDLGIYIISMWCIFFIFIFIFIDLLYKLVNMNIHTYQSHEYAFAWFFQQFQPGIAYKRVAYKESLY